jgi:hypothetical protein
MDLRSTHRSGSCGSTPTGLEFSHASTQRRLYRREASADGDRVPLVQASQQHVGQLACRRGVQVVSDPVDRNLDALPYAVVGEIDCNMAVWPVPRDHRFVSLPRVDTPWFRCFLLPNDRTLPARNFADPILGTAIASQLMAKVCEHARPRRPDGHGESWAALRANHDQLKTWLVGSELTSVKATELLCRKGVVVPERTVQRYALKVLGVGRSARSSGRPRDKTWRPRPSSCP